MHKYKGVVNIYHQCVFFCTCVTQVFAVVK